MANDMALIRETRVLHEMYVRRIRHGYSVMSPKDRLAFDDEIRRQERKLRALLNEAYAGDVQ
jgi:hypothetical protein